MGFEIFSVPTGVSGCWLQFHLWDVRGRDPRGLSPMPFPSPKAPSRSAVFPPPFQVLSCFYIECPGFSLCLAREVGKSTSDRLPRGPGVLVTGVLLWIHVSDQHPSSARSKLCSPRLLITASVLSWVQGLMFIIGKLVWFGLWFQHDQGQDLQVCVI